MRRDDQMGGARGRKRAAAEPAPAVAAKTAKKAKTEEKGEIFLRNLH